MTRGQFTHPQEALAEAIRTRNQALYEQAAQVWSHQLYFDSMVPGAEGPDEFALRILGAGFTDRWVSAAESVFGSGWVWLVANRAPVRTPHGLLLRHAEPKIVATKDAQLPAGAPIMVMDVWEHAYYCQYPGRRAEYAREWVDRLADWSRLAPPQPRQAPPR